MSERVERVDTPRATTGREWELFVREEADESLGHVGSLTAPTRESALERATELFGWTTADVWLCPAEEVERVGIEQ
ncbi:Htur_1727 family rSAM-partnered candidate RiPP [Halorientalis marina]|jgi:rSAM-partnered protein|uniref:Htur_1727 family rSAM-partnered candidate RiPP n=1 Tax=Halorientalis marina TaxID=2931976 RepID=UPI001FF13364|nr:Htur_1727 family rSAM-partnered candidate RiPP [Halorientalis marina]